MMGVTRLALLSMVGDVKDSPPCVDQFVETASFDKMSNVMMGTIKVKMDALRHVRLKLATSVYKLLESCVFQYVEIVELLEMNIVMMGMYQMILNAMINAQILLEDGYAKEEISRQNQIAL